MCAFLNSKGWTREQTDLALMQIIARAVHPYSELKTVRYLQENTALAEMFKIPKQKITKDALYKSAHRLWDVHREMEDWLHERVCSVFNLEEKILLLDITNTYFEGRMDESEICQYGRSKKKRDAVNNRLGKLDQKYGAIRMRSAFGTLCCAKNYTVTFTYEGKGKDEKAISMTWTRNTEKSDMIRKFHGKYVLITSLDETDEVNIWEFYNVIRTVEETFHVLKTDLDIRPVYHKTDDGIKGHLNLAVLAYWVVSVTKHRLKVKGYKNVRWDEIIRIASTQVVVTAKVQTEDGREISIRQSTQAEDKLGAIYDLLHVNPHPLDNVKSVGPPKIAFKK